MSESRAPLRDGLAIAAGGWIARAAVAVWAWNRFPPVADGAYYQRIATRIAEGAGYTWPWPDGTITYAAHYPVGYPALLAPWYAVFGATPGIAMLVNAALGASAALAVHRAVARTSTRMGAALASGLVAFHPALVLYTPALMTEGVTAALLGVALWLTVRAREADRRRAAWIAALGLLFGGLTLLRPQTLLLAPLFGALGARSRGALGATVLAVAVCLPWTLRNCARMDQCVFVSANGGWNAYIGAAPGASGTWAPLEDLGVPAECRGVFGEAEKDRCFGSAAVRRITSDPAGWLLLAPAKLAATFDYSGAPGWYLRASNPDAFGEGAKVGLGAVETVWERLALMAALAGVALRGGPRAKARRALGALGAVFAVVWSAWIAHVLLVGVVALLGRRAGSAPVAVAAAGGVLATAVTHVVFFGAGRYQMVCFALLAAAAGEGIERARAWRAGKRPSAPPVPEL